MQPKKGASTLRFLELFGPFEVADVFWVLNVVVGLGGTMGNPFKPPFRGDVEMNPMLGGLATSASSNVQHFALVKGRKSRITGPRAS